jgi:hypothetical protein
MELFIICLKSDCYFKIKDWNSFSFCFSSGTWSDFIRGRRHECRAESERTVYGHIHDVKHINIPIKHIGRAGNQTLDLSENHRNPLRYHVQFQT